MRTIATLSGGKASAYAAHLAIQKYGKENVILYFNDTKVEDDDLYRFLDDLSTHFGITITKDSDGRTPEELFYDMNMLANNRAPFCSRVLKAERLQKFCQDGDILIFGIGKEEAHRAVRISRVYDEVARRRKIELKMDFPLLSDNHSRTHVDEWLNRIGIEEPIAYKLGFAHNNCLGMGGCVRQGKAGWLHLLKIRPDKYTQMEEMEEDFRLYSGKDVHILPDTTLRQLRQNAEKQLELFSYTYEATTECVGICNTEN